MPALIIAGGPGMKPPKPPSKGGPASPKMAPPKPPEQDALDPAAGSGKVSKEDCLFVGSDKHCGNCQKYSPEDGSCSKVDGTFDPEDACLRYFEALGDSDQDASAEPDMDADDTGVMPA